GGEQRAGSQRGARGQWAGRGASAGGGSADRGAAGGAGGAFAGRGGGTRVWVMRAGKAEPVWVGTGSTDGQRTEVFSRDLKDGDEVIVDVATSGAKE
ncbi:MAG TPA: hypothetical protein VN923_12945, partial [Thermoanaerobaculia bacterium]|nr:hypothetical protein [Thermoanaerobaculia bacterium]